MDKNIEALFEKLGLSENIKKKYVQTQKMIDDISTYVKNDIEDVRVHKNKESVERIENYMPIVQDFIKIIADKREFIIIKEIAKELQKANNEIESYLRN